MTRAGAALTPDQAQVAVPDQTTMDAWAQAACALLRCTVGGEILLVNETLRQWVGLEAHETPLALFDLCTPASLLFFEMQLRPLLSLGQPIEGAFLTLKHRDGSAVPVILNATQQPGRQVIDLALLSVREREQYEASLREAQANAEQAMHALQANAHALKMQAVGQMAAGIAHEFNNLLAVVQGNIGFAEQGVRRDPSLSSARVLDDLASALAASERASAMVRQLLAFTGRQITRRSTIDLNEVVRDTAQLMTPALGRDVTWQAHLADDLWPVHASADQMQHALTNIILNARDAVRASHSPGLVTVSTANLTGATPDDDRVQVVVQDTGVGMTEEVKQRAIDPFFTTKPPGQGVGLGLSMAYGAVSALNGQLQMESAPGVGTRLTITLPRANAPRAAEPPAAVRPAAEPGATRLTPPD